MSAGYAITTEAAVALSAATAKTVLGVVAASSVGAKLTEINAEFDGATSTAVPVLVELCRGDGTSAGTVSSSTVRQIRGITRTAQCSGIRNATAEPTVLTVLKAWLVHPQTSRQMQFPLGREVEHVGAGGLYLRCTAPATVNVRAGMEFEEG